jgi:hypothetical protein
MISLTFKSKTMAADKVFKTTARRFYVLVKHFFPLFPTVVIFPQKGIGMFCHSGSTQKNSCKGMSILSRENR